MLACKNNLVLLHLVIFQFLLELGVLFVFHWMFVICFDYNEFVI